MGNLINLIKKHLKTVVEEVEGRDDGTYMIISNLEQMKKDISNYLPFINSGGFIGGHDFHPGWRPMRPAPGADPRIAPKRFTAFAAAPLSNVSHALTKSLSCTCSQNVCPSRLNRTQ